LMSREIIKTGKPVYAFEPDSVAFAELCKIKNPNFNGKQEAAWISDGEMELFRHKDWENTKSHTSSSLNASKKNVDSRDNYTERRQL
jgi:hypothetical protein